MSANIRPGISPVSESAAAGADWRTAYTPLARLANLLLRGKMNATTTVTLTPSTTTTTLTDERIGPKSAVKLVPATASAATAVLTAPGIYVVTTDGSATIHHPSNAAVDQTFSVVVIG